MNTRRCINPIVALSRAPQVRPVPEIATAGRSRVNHRKSPGLRIILGVGELLCVMGRTISLLNMMTLLENTIHVAHFAILNAYIQ